ncbi:MAG: NADPH-dependent glutamate synthase [Clostridiales bacterium]|jgi:glutamate synthase (NADPH/NADH) small chain|nr:NADPH-dependent glutamate synthase [Clostridiales bacterium]
MAIDRSPRNRMPEQAPKLRAKNFDEVALGFSPEQAKAEASRCLQCKNAPCKSGCPVGVDIPEFLKAVQTGDFEGAGAVIGRANSLPAVCGRVCPQEEQCEKLCLRGRMDKPVAIGAVERFVGDFGLDKTPAPYDGPRTGKRAAVIGSGPSGLTVAAELAKNGVDVTIYEAFHRAGGVLVYGIPEFRLPKSLVRAEIDKLLRLGVTLMRNVVVGKTVLLDELTDRFDAVFIGSGAGLPMFMNLKGESYKGVISANEYLTRVNLMGAYRADSDTPVQRGRRVAVIGAGNVAMDAARTALRMGADSVTVVYRRGREEMPARAEEIHHAEEEGVRFELLAAPVEILGENGAAAGLLLRRTELSEPDASGRRRPVELAGSEFTIGADMVIVALGTSPNPLIKDSYPAIETTKKGTIVVDGRGMTSVDGVYAGGDAVTGAATVILAMGAGRKAAAAILERFKGQ